jgi:hypothetical protein
MGPYFAENQVYPLFVNWKTGIGETIWNLAEDAVRGPEHRGPAEGIVDWISEKASEAKDRTLEVVAEWAVKPFWTQMKQNARLASRFPAADPLEPADRALAAMLQHIAALREDFPDLELHVVGHSAGSIMLGEMLPDLEALQLPIKTCTLWAPACTLELALEKYKPAMESDLGILGMTAERFAIEILTDAREQADSSGPYGKSILYLVSRALEDFHKMPLLGMAREWDNSVDARVWGRSGKSLVEAWRYFAAQKRIRPAEIISQDTIEVILEEHRQPSTHGNFDNDVRALQRALKRILGGQEPRYEVENLMGF